ncbi:MAG: SDR family NAD(P)-dependent oxidoreductase [Pseudomonadota bacterium]
MITGASRGLGAALAIEAADEDVHLSLTARQIDALAHTKAACENKGAKVDLYALDLTDAQSLPEFQGNLADAPDIFIANAGIFDGRSAADDLEDAQTIQDILQTNLVGTLQLCHAIAERMRTRGSGHIVTISSLAGVAPLADAPIYTASKAGLSAYSEAIAAYLEPFGILVTDARAGHIETEQTAVQNGGMPMMLSPQAAAKTIIHGIRKKRRVIQVPWTLAIGAHLSGFLPWRLRQWAMASHRFYVDKKDKQ